MQIVAVRSTEDVTLTGLQVNVRLTKVQEKALGLQTFWQRLGLGFFGGVVCTQHSETFF